MSPIYHRNTNALILNSMGHCDSHELRRGRNETPRSCPKLTESDQFSIRLPRPLIPLREQRNCQEFAGIIRVSFHLIFYPTSSHFHSKRPWSLFIGFFIFLAILGPLLPFLFGRIMVIETFTRVRATPSPPSLLSS